MKHVAPVTKQHVVRAQCMFRGVKAFFAAIACDGDTAFYDTIMFDKGCRT